MKVKAIIRTEFPALRMILEEGEVTTIPGIETPEGRALYAASLGKDPKDVTEEDAKAICDAILANPNVQRVDGGVQQPRTKAAEKKEEEAQE